MLSSILGSSKESHSASSEETSLDTILSTLEERSEFILLIANCALSMRKGIVDTFDAKQIGKPSDLTLNLTGDDALRNPNLDLANVDVEALDKQRKEQEKREKELSEPKMQELKNAALDYFDQWREAVLERVREVINPNKGAEHKPKEANKNQLDEANEKVVTEQTKQDVAVGQAVHELFLPVETPLTSLPEAKKALVMHSLLLLLLSLENYSAHSRVLLLYLISSLNLPINLLADDEAKIARALLQAADQMSADEETKKRADENQGMRKWKVGLASVAGAALIGITGGLAAPLLAAGIGSVMGGLGLGATAAAGYLGALASSSVIVGGLFGAYGGRMTGKMMDQYAREVEDFAFVPIKDFHKPRKIEKEYRRLRVAVGISGWLTEKEEVVKPWRFIGPSIEGFALRWELESLMNLGNSMTTLIKSVAWGTVKSEIIKRTVFASLTAALWPLGLLKVSRIIDNPFSVAKHRSEKAGEVLADALINKAQGERPVTLIGYSLGARVIYSCLMTLAERKAFGLVESVVLLGAPIPSTPGDWRKVRSVVSGRVVNVYSTKDYILAFLYRTSSIQYGIAGLQPVEGVKGVQNVDVSDSVSGHMRYRYLTGSILKKIGFEDIDVMEVEQEEADLRAAEEREEAERRKKEQEAGTSGKDVDDEAKEIEQEVQEKNELGMASWAAEKLRLSSASPASSPVRGTVAASG